jgi:arylsulfatase
MMRKQMYPDEPPAYGMPYDGIENLRPETKAAVEAFLFKQSSPKK